jgi:predicted transcriptional regulator
MATVKSTAEAEAEAKASRAFTSDVDLFEGLSPKERELLERPDPRAREREDL